MLELNEKEMYEVAGGGFSWGIAALIAAGIIFIVGVIDGIINLK